MKKLTVIDITLNQSAKKYHSVDIEGPLEPKCTEDGRVFRVKLEIVNEDNILTHSTYFIRHFNEHAHPMLFNHLQKCMDEGKELKLLAYPISYDLSLYTLAKNCKSDNIEGYTNRFITIMMLDEHPMTLFTIENYWLDLEVIYIINPNITEDDVNKSQELR